MVVHFFALDSASLLHSLMSQRPVKVSEWLVPMAGIEVISLVL